LIIGIQTAPKKTAKPNAKCCAITPHMFIFFVRLPTTHACSTAAEQGLGTTVSSVIDASYVLFLSVCFFFFEKVLQGQMASRVDGLFGCAAPVDSNNFDH